jgi:hypothetical protein
MVLLQNTVPIHCGAGRFTGYTAVHCCPVPGRFYGQCQKHKIYTGIYCTVILFAFLNKMPRPEEFSLFKCPLLLEDDLSIKRT